MFIASCASILPEKFADMEYPANFASADETSSGKIIFTDASKGGKNIDDAKNARTPSCSSSDVVVAVKKGIKYPVSNPLLAFRGGKAEKGTLNFFFMPFVGNDSHLSRNRYRAYLTVGGVRQELKQNILIFAYKKDRAYLKRSFVLNGLSYRFQDAFSDSYVKYPYMFGEVSGSQGVYKIFAVDENAKYEKRFLSNSIINGNGGFLVFFEGSLVARFSKTDYTLYGNTDGNASREIVAVVSSIFRFIEENEKR